MSRRDLSQATGASLRSVAEFLRTLQDQGAVYVSELRHQDGANKPSEMFSLQRVPFELPDVEREL